MSSELMTVNGNRTHAVATLAQWTPEQVDLLKRTVCKGATEDEFQLFMYQCNRTRLDPFAKQIHAVKRYDSKLKKEVMAIQTGIDGYRLIADRTKLYEGQSEPEWCGDDGVWKTVWLAAEPPRAARVGIWKKGFRVPVYGVALWSEYKQEYFRDSDKSWQLTPMWRKMGSLMLSKCAEALGLRKAFPQELSGVHTDEEMAQADNQEVVVIPQIPSPTGEEDKEHAVRMRAARAALSKSLSAAKEVGEFAKARGAFQKEYGKEIWEKLTCHNETETFFSLTAEIWNGHEGAKKAETNAAEYAQDFINRMEACFDLKEFQELEKEFKASLNLPNNQVAMDALYAKGRELGVSDYAIDEDPAIDNRRDPK